MLKKSEINIFGEDSLAHVDMYGESYAVIRDYDHKILAMSQGWERFMGCTVRTMYTGAEYATGDYILVADTVNGPEQFYTFHEF